MAEQAMPTFNEVPVLAYTVTDRLKLHDILVAALGSRHVYFQPPESIKLEYPCIVYKRDNLVPDYANDKKYAYSTRYQVTVIDQDPDSRIVRTIFNLPLCSYANNFVADGLNHDVFELYY